MSGADACRHARAVLTEILQARPAQIAAADDAWSGPHREAFRERHERITAQAFEALERLAHVEAALARHTDLNANGPAP